MIVIAVLAKTLWIFQIVNIENVNIMHTNGMGEMDIARHLFSREKTEIGRKNSWDHASSYYSLGFVWFCEGSWSESTIAQCLKSWMSKAIQLSHNPREKVGFELLTVF